MPSSRTDPPILLHDGRYRLHQRLGRGRMGVVYQATDELLQRDVAIKFLATEQLDNHAYTRFAREARAVARLAHANIMTLYDIGREGEWHYLILEHIDGRTLADLLQTQPDGLGYAQVMVLIRAILDGLQHAHEHGIIHRDLKPANIMLTAANQPKIADFGLAQVLDEAQLTQTGMIVGTMRYLAPELLKGQAADVRTDLYALGAIFYELLTGYPPFPQQELTTLMWHIAHEPVLPPQTIRADIPSAVEEVVLRLLDKEPLRRYQAAAAVLEALPLVDSPRATAESSSTRLLIERLAAQPLSTTTRALIDQALAADQTAVLEAERRRLAKRLQEQIIEPLNLLLSQAAAYQQSLASNPQARMALSVLTTLVRQTLQQTRDLESDLHPAVLESLGLEPALERLANQMIRTYGVQITLQIERLAERLAPLMELLLFRTTQELVEQAIQDGHANHITIRLTQQKEQLTYMVGDNGLAERSPLKATTAAQLQTAGGIVNGRFEPTSGFIWQIVFTRPAAVELTPRELETLQLVVQGLSNKEIAARLQVTPRTVNFHLDNIYSKLGVSSRTEAAVIALQQGWV